MEKIIKIGDKDVKFKATAALPRLYRIKFRKDIFQDFTKLIKEFEKVQKSKDGNPVDGDELSIPSLEVFENVAFCMAKHADPEGVPSNIDEWLDGFEMFNIYQVLPELIELWNINTETFSNSKKK